MKVEKNSLWESFHKYGYLQYRSPAHHVNFANKTISPITTAGQEEVPDEWVMKLKGSRLALPNENSYSCRLSPKGFVALKNELKAQFQNPTRAGRIPQVGYPSMIQLNASSTWDDYEAAVMDFFAVIEKATKKHIANLKKKIKDQEQDIEAVFG